MKKGDSNRIIYHYCSTQTMYAILQSHTLRMSDITKSNDYEEIYMFFPGILDAIYDERKSIGRIARRYILNVIKRVKIINL